jgi:integrase
MRTRTGDFGIFPRRSRKTVYFYYWIYDLDGKRKYRSTGKQTYNEALRYCRNLQIKGMLFQATSYSFTSFTENFFIYEKCPYISSRLLRGFSYGRTWADRQRKLLKKIIAPYFKDIDIRTISLKQIDDFVVQLRFANRGAKTINHILTTIKAIFGYAVKIGILEINPAANIKPFNAAAKEKGVFTREELSRLFNNQEPSEIWKEPMHFLLNYLAIITGLRLGEILALRPENIMESTINIIHSWNRLDGLKCTKTGKIRSVPVSYDFVLSLKDFILSHNVTGFIFSANSGKTPIDHKIVYKHFWHALSNIGISQELRKTRNISFHSYRHTFNTMLLEAGVHPETIRLITGHSINMTARYSHAQLNNMQEVIKKIPVINQSSLIPVFIK